MNILNIPCIKHVTMFKITHFNSFKFLNIQTKIKKGVDHEEEKKGKESQTHRLPRSTTTQRM